MKQTLMHRYKNPSQDGFTIIELMIATMLFSVVLLLVTFGLLQVTRTYYKGVTGAKTQQTARAIIDQISRSIQFSGSTITDTPATQNSGDSFAFCVGDSRYSVLIDRQVVDGTPNAANRETNHALVVDTLTSCNQLTSPQPLAGGSLSDSSRELIPPNMRVANLTVREITRPGDIYRLYDVRVSIISGDNGLLAGGEPDTPADPNYHKQCANFRAGTQFCAVSTLSTTVQKRIN